MAVIVNGEQKSADPGTTLKQFLEATGTRVRVAVELNGRVVPRESFDKVVLKDGDSLEIVTLVGGG